MGGDRAACATTGADDQHGFSRQFDGQGFFDGMFEAIAIGVRSAGGVGIEADGIDRAENPRGVIDIAAGGQGVELVGDRDVAADETEFAHAGKGFGDLTWLDFKGDVAGIDASFIERRLVHAG